MIKVEFFYEDEKKGEFLSFRALVDGKVATQAMAFILNSRPDDIKMLKPKKKKPYTSKEI